MTGFSPIKKTFLSIGCAFLLIIYVPVACVVGNDFSDEADIAQAETHLCEEETTEAPSEPGVIYIYE